MATYYRVVAFGAPSGAVSTSPEAAWASWERAVSRYYDDDQMGAARSAHHPRLIQATTRRAALDADVSESCGSVGRGEWWTVG